MSSLAQDELGHAAALYGLLARADRHRPRRPRLRPRAGRLPPLPAARPRPRRLGDDDRPTLPVRHRRCRPARGARGRVVGATGGARREAGARGAVSPDARRCVARPAGPERGRGARPVDLGTGRTRSGRRDRLLATPRRTGTPRRRDTGRPDDRAGEPLAGRDRADLREASACRCRHRSATRRGAGSTTAKPSAGCGASSPRSAGPIRERPGERVGRPDRSRSDPRGSGDRPPCGRARAGQGAAPRRDGRAPGPGGGHGPRAADAVGRRSRDRPSRRHRGRRRADPRRDPADLRRLSGARAHQALDRASASPSSGGRSRSRRPSRSRGPPSGSARPGARPCSLPGSRHRAGTRLASASEA